MADRRPQVSVIMASRNAAAHLPLAIRAVLAQTLTDLELIIVDDASEDDSWAVIRAAAAADPRLRAQRRPHSGGPAIARNDALALARGDWIAICDSDDSQHPRRLELMLNAAGDLAADVVADDMILFSEQPMARGATILGQHAPKLARMLNLKDLVLSGVDPEGISHIGYLKPLIRRRFLSELRYDPRLRIGEDHDLYLRLVLAGAKMWVLPMAAYLYRRHAASTSYRNVPGDLAAQVDVLDDLVKQAGNEDLAALAHVRRRALVRRHAQLELARDVRAGHLGQALRRAVMRPDHLPWLASVVRNRVELKVQAAASRLWRRPQRWRLEGRDGGGGAVRLPTDDRGNLDLSAAAAPIWARLCCAASRRQVEAEATDALGQSALWMVPALRALAPEASDVANGTRAQGSACAMAGLADRERVAVESRGHQQHSAGRDDTDG
ncbi:glycosyltransferase family 2 protein [Phaeobacter gallaeciensis]|uniref:Glycosyltransferase involved in cell wall biogenesis n=1 Tax=Phaeobacter gallaeciensis TaxID=60890 RepID=A0AAD0EEX4_9RHOB|nr:glycosyltransferase [Phaeobacter gallaeciensis]AHD11438.1 Glycosyltransferase involved in cell wall biogenesis [Phaeobacter gallaeciensis DSM 26640]ATE94702.1 Glycosyltransferase involved in cell wall biogenesis [Phaeobacter gallaeciensis]ATE98974.1 Glycosyltransferase involved in cell wall biogenesis [Phaeobacter gallaeciensis]ATF03366.1 Glycosyltransferase involved in cell wall biogenesis [Phaeobacter gallaeciensis]ATF07746.1 Glycosyltransferase involved in cell wall biogenesis [Phaeobact